MKVTVITVCLNEAKPLSATLRSVAQQTYTGFEYVVQDRGSIDETAEILSQFRPRVDVLRVERDASVLSAMNRAASVAVGDFAIFLNAGSVFPERGTMAQVANALDETGQCDVLSGDALDVTTGRRKAFLPQEKYWLGATFDYQACAIRTEVHRRFPLDEEFEFCADLDQVSKIHAMAGSIFRRTSIPFTARTYDPESDFDYATRLNERLRLLNRHFGATHPVEAEFKAEVLERLESRFDMGHLRDRLSMQPLEDVLNLYARVASSCV